MHLKKAKEQYVSCYLKPFCVLCMPWWHDTTLLTKVGCKSAPRLAYATNNKKPHSGL
jgi:hypothetical protein